MALAHPMTHRHRPFSILLAWALALSGACGGASADEAAAPARWPSTVVTMEQLTPLTRFSLQVPGVVAKGQVIGPAVVRAHLGADGAVGRVALLSSSGNPDLDEASMHAMRAMRFEPVTADGVATEATLVVPVHVPPRLGRSPR